MGFSREQKNNILLVGFVACGTYLWMKNRPPSKDDEAERIGEERLQELISQDRHYLRRDPSELDRLEARLDRAAQGLDRDALQQGISHEMIIAKNPYVAKKQAIERLREDPDYYRPISDDELFEGGPSRTSEETPLHLVPDEPPEAA
jgi:hypothetical protein